MPPDLRYDTYHNLSAPNAHRTIFSNGRVWTCVWGNQDDHHHHDQQSHLLPPVVLMIRWALPSLSCFGVLWKGLLVVLMAVDWLGHAQGQLLILEEGPVALGPSNLG